MGRYITNTETNETIHKFWFGCQPSDVGDYAEQYQPSYEVANIERNELPKVRAKIKELERVFKNEFEMTFQDFMKKIETKGYLSSSKDEETNTEKWNKMCELGARIDLGHNILKEFKNGKEYLEMNIEL